MDEKLKIALAYSGGLDTSTIVPWLIENYDCEVYAILVNIGQDEDIDDAIARALQYGAKGAYAIDAVDEFADEYLLPMLKSGAVYENKYLLGTSVARPLIAKRLIMKAKELGCTAISHGATGKGNDQVRFELTTMALAPEMKIIAPWREWSIRSRDDALAYLEGKGIHLQVAAEETYSRDANLWHLSHEGLELESPANAPEYTPKLLKLTSLLEETPDEAEEISIDFEQGKPVALNGESLSFADMIRALNKIGGKHGIGIVDLVENRVVGMKSRGVYETPGGTILVYAHNDLEELCLDKESSLFKRYVALKYAEVVYQGKWFLPLKTALDSFIDETQKTVTGNVKLRLYKGNIISAGKTSPYTLYSEEIASFTTGSLYDHHDAEGFIKLYGLPLKMHAAVREIQKSE
ncbi:MAG: argininosuccinate synthase [Eubacteriaceae bacterium]|nr:argininosuccinate synthase [Eubacteriaceae bacterium]